MTERVYIATDIARRADYYHTRACQNTTESDLTEISIHTARNNALDECPCCAGESIRKGLAGDLATMSPSEVGL
jgi:hypothetical protein